MSTELLSTRDLTGGYGDIVVVREISVRVDSGETMFITGRNGVGKSTLVKLISGNVLPMSGHVTFRGRDVSSTPAYMRRRIGLGYAPQEDFVFDELTVAENLTLRDSSRILYRFEHLFDEFPFLRRRLTQMAGTLSGGEKKVLSFCRAMAEETLLVILDEPTEGVQPENIAKMSRLIKMAAEQNRSFLIVEQNLNLVEETASQVHLLDRGQCVFSSKNRNGLRDALDSRLQL